MLAPSEHFIETKLFSRKKDFTSRIAIVPSFNAVDRAVASPDVAAVAVRLPTNYWGNELELISNSLKGQDIGLAFGEDEDLDVRHHANGLIVHDNYNTLFASPTRSFRALGVKLAKNRVAAPHYPFNRLSNVVGMMTGTVARLNKASSLEVRFLRDFKPGFSVADDIGMHFDMNTVGMLGLHGRNVLSVAESAEWLDQFIQGKQDRKPTLAEFPLGMPFFAKGLRSNNPLLHAGPRRVSPQPIDRASIVVSAESGKRIPFCDNAAVQRIQNFVDIKKGGARRFTQLLTNQL